MSVFSYATKALKMTNPIDATKEIFRAGAESVKMAIESPKRWISDPTNVVQNVLMDVEQISKTVPYMNQTMTDDDIPLNPNVKPVFNQSAYKEAQAKKAAQASMTEDDIPLINIIKWNREYQQAQKEKAAKEAAEAAEKGRMAKEAVQATGGSAVENANEIAVTYPEGTAGLIEDAQNASLEPYTNQRSGLNLTALLVYGLIGYGVYKLITGNKKNGD